MTYLFRVLVSTVVHLSIAATSYMLAEVDRRDVGADMADMFRRKMIGALTAELQVINRYL